MVPTVRPAFDKSTSYFGRLNIYIAYQKVLQYGLTVKTVDVIVSDLCAEDLNR